MDTSDRNIDAALAAALTLPEYPRAAEYPPRWALENLMGPNVLWLAEALSQAMDLQPGMRVLDMGCGKAISSIFLAREFGLTVTAADLWIKPTDNWQRILESGADHQVVPISVEAHTLPFAAGYFDAIVSLDAYQYFGTNDLYLAYFAQFVREGGQIGIVVPGLTHELENGLPDHLEPYWESDYWCFHSPDWWRRSWERSGQVQVDVADMVPDGWSQWLRWLEVCAQHGFKSSDREAAMVRADAGRTLGFARIVARKV